MIDIEGNFVIFTDRWLRDAGYIYGTTTALINNLPNATVMTKKTPTKKKMNSVIQTLD